MALFLTSRFKNFRPPLAIGLLMWAMFISARFFFHTKFFIWLSRLERISFGMPCALVRYWEQPPTIIWTTCLRPSIPGFPLSHLVSLISISFVIFFHFVVSLPPFPIHAPRIRVSSPCCVKWIFDGIETSCAFNLRVCMNVSLNSLLPIGMISVLVILNFALAALHHVSRILVRELYLLFLGLGLILRLRFLGLFPQAWSFGLWFVYGQLCSSFSWNQLGFCG